MATLRITGLTTSAFWLNDIYATIPASTSTPAYLDVTRSPAEISMMRGLQEAVADGTVSVTVTYSADELAALSLVKLQPLASSLVDGSVSTAALQNLSVTAGKIDSGAVTAAKLAADSVGTGTFVPVAAATVMSTEVVLRQALVSGGAAGTADDVTIYAVNTLPYKVRILDAWVVLSTGHASDATVREVAGGAGTVSATVDCTATGITHAKALGAANTSIVYTPGPAVGLFLRRDRSVVGELFILARKES